MRTSAVGQPENTDAAQLGDQYANKHNPFVYFHSIIDDRARCDAHVVNLDLLAADLADPARTPNYAFITPNLCNDGHDDPCVDGSAGACAAIDEFLKAVGAADHGLRGVQAGGCSSSRSTSPAASAPRGPPRAAASAACRARRTRPGLNGPGGGRIGAVVLSPFVKPGTVAHIPYNHYALLRTVEAIFALPRLGYAAAPRPARSSAPTCSALPRRLHPLNEVRHDRVRGAYQRAEQLLHR